jgi:hypothetical protein
MKKIYSLLFVSLSFATFAQQTISFEAGEGFQLGTLHQQNGWEVTEGSDGFIQNQVISNEAASDGSFSFKNAYEPDFDIQWYPIFGAAKAFDEPADYSSFTISYDVMVTEKMGADFEFTLYAVDASEEFTPVAGVGIENRGYIYLIKDENYGFDYAQAEWDANQWTNVKIEVTTEEIKYYINNVLEATIPNFSQLNIEGFNMLHNNYGGDGYYDNVVITTGNLSTEKPVQSESITVFPNPANNKVSVNIPNATIVDSVAIYNITGQKVLTTANTQNIDISSLSAGTYFIKVTGNNAVYTKKIIKS